MRRLAIGLILLTIAGCGHRPKLVRIQGTNAPLDRQASAYVALPVDGSYGSIIYKGSGAQTATAVANAFAPHLHSIVLAEAHQDIDDATQYAKERHYKYLLYPQILHWEDRATEWSGRRDAVSINLSVIIADSGTVLDSATIAGQSKLITFGGGHPQDLLPSTLEKYATELFQ
jgi:Domain of unknown function (DUF4823)